MLKYMGQALADDRPGTEVAVKPIVTISREYGCPSKLIAQMLTDALNHRVAEAGGKKWKFINKEVLESAAKELQLNPADVKYLLSVGEKSLLEDFLVSFSSMYVSNLKVKHTLEKVVKTIAQAGNVVLVGRGSAAILRARPASLHVRLQAPLEWRVRSVSDTCKVGESEALHIIEITDKKRNALYELLMGKKFDCHIFDAVFNCSTLTKQEIVHGITGTMEARGML